MKAPLGWQKIVNQYLKKINSQKQQEKQWEEITGIKLKDSRFTIAMPIHNEERLLLPVIEALMLSNIPRTSPVTIIFVTNGSTDKDATSDIIKNFMKSLGKLEKIPLKKLSLKVQDFNISPFCLFVSYKNMQFIHIDTPIASKANALNLANEFVLNRIEMERRDPVLICLDANNFVEPISIAHLYKAGYDNFVKNSQGMKVVTPGYIKFDRPLEITDLPKELQISQFRQFRTADILPVTYGKRKIILTGPFFAWSPRAIQAIGGIPNVAVEDAALALKVNLKIAFVPSAPVWSIVESELKVRKKQLVRQVRGFSQIIRLFPEFENAIRDDVFFMKRKEDRKNILEQWVDNLKIPIEKRKGVISYLMHEWNEIIDKGLAEFVKNPEYPSWQDIKETK